MYLLWDPVLVNFNIPYTAALTLFLQIPMSFRPPLIMGYIISSHFVYIIVIIVTGYRIPSIIVYVKDIHLLFVYR